MRLINADELEKEGWQLVRVNPQVPPVNQYKSLKDVSTAFDFDGVVKELKDHSLHAKMKAASLFCEEGYTKDAIKQSVKHSCDMQAWAFDKSVDIIKKGGIVKDVSDTEEVCEWIEDIYGRWHTQCNILSDNDPLEYTFCPYCGKRIKVMG